MEKPALVTTCLRTKRETLGSAQVEVHWIRAGAGSEIALTHLFPLKKKKHLTPVILVHGNYTQRGFWISPKGLGLAPFMMEKGYDPWIVELRGHGHSPKGHDFSSITAEDHIKEDLPSAVAYVLQQTGKPSFLVGHSAGGIFIAAALSAGCVSEDHLQGAALFGTQITLGESYLKFPPLTWFLGLLLRVIGHLPAERLGLGPEPEPAGEMLEFIRWKKLGGIWQDSQGYPYWSGLSRLRLPVLAVAAARDRNDPPQGCRQLLEEFGSPDRRFVLLSRKNGFLKDYDHIGMIVSKEAATEVWPLLIQWMDEKRVPPVTPNH